MESLAFKGRLIAVGYMDGINNVEIDLTLRPDSDKYGEANMQVYRKNTIGKVGSDYVIMYNNTSN